MTPEAIAHALELSRANKHMQARNALLAALPPHDDGSSRPPAAQGLRVSAASPAEGGSGAAGGGHEAAAEDETAALLEGCSAVKAEGELVHTLRLASAVDRLRQDLGSTAEWQLARKDAATTTYMQVAPGASLARVRVEVSMPVCWGRARAHRPCAQPCRAVRSALPACLTACLTACLPLASALPHRRAPCRPACWTSWPSSTRLTCTRGGCRAPWALACARAARGRASA